MCERTLKYFQGIAGRCWVLSFDWVTHSVQSGHFLPEVYTHFSSSLFLPPFPLTPPSPIEWVSRQLYALVDMKFVFHMYDHFRVLGLY